MPVCLGNPGVNNSHKLGGDGQSDYPRGPGGVHLQFYFFGLGGFKMLMCLGNPGVNRSHLKYTWNTSQCALEYTVFQEYKNTRIFAKYFTIFLKKCISVFRAAMWEYRATRNTPTRSVFRTVFPCLAPHPGRGGACFRLRRLRS